jgi:protein SCO1/2
VAINKCVKLTTLFVVVIAIASILFYGIVQKQKQGMQQQAMSGTTSPIDGIMVPQPTEMADFKLINTAGKSFTRNDLKGKWTFLFFGFTNCATVCPTTLSSLNKMYAQLEKELPKDQLPQIVLVSVDPERDTLDRMNEYLHSFNPHFIGARAELPVIEVFEKQLHVIAVKMQADGQGPNHYSVNHTAEILLINPQAQVQAYLSYPHNAEQMVKDYKFILNKTAS